MSRADAWDVDSIESIFAGRVLAAVEGVWQFPQDGARILIKRASSSTFEIVLLDSPRLDLAPGICIGQLVETPTLDKYDATLDSKPLANPKIKKAHAVVTVNSDGRLAIKPYSTGKKVSFRRWIPYFLRINIRDQQAPDGLIGAKKTYPIDPADIIPCL